MKECDILGVKTYTTYFEPHPAWGQDPNTRTYAPDCLIACLVITVKVSLSLTHSLTRHSVNQSINQNKHTVIARWFTIYISKFRLIFGSDAADFFLRP